MIAQFAANNFRLLPAPPARTVGLLWSPARKSGLAMALMCCTAAWLSIAGSALGQLPSVPSADPDAVEAGEREESPAGPDGKIDSKPERRESAVPKKKREKTPRERIREIPLRPEYIPALAKGMRNVLVTDEVADVMVRIGTPAIPALVEIVKEEDNGVVDLEAVHALGRLGPAARPAIPALIDALKVKQPKVVAGIVDALADIGDAAIEPLMAGLNDRSTPGRYNCARALAKFGPRAAAAVPRLTELASNRREDRTVRFWAVAALGEIGPAAQSSIPVLIDALGNFDRRDRYIVARTLGRMGPAAGGAVDELMRIFKGSDGLYNIEAADTALASIGAPAMPALFELVRQDDNRRLRLTAEETLARIGTRGLEQFVDALQDRDPAVREVAADILVQIGEPAAPRLFPLLRHQHERLRRDAALILSDIPAAAPAAVPVLIDLLQSDAYELRTEAAEALARIGPGAEAAIDPLIEALQPVASDPLLAQLDQQQQQRYRRLIATALVSIGQPAVAPLAQAFLSPHQPVRHSCSLALGRMSQEEPKALEALVALVANEEHAEVSKLALEALKVAPPDDREMAKLGPGAIPSLLIMLSQGEPEVQLAAANALVHLGEKSIPGLTLLLRSKDLRTRDLSVMALGGLGLKAVQTSPHIFQSLDIERELMKSDDHPSQEWYKYMGRVADTLYKFGRPAIPVSIRALEINNPSVQIVAASALAQHGYRAKDAVRNLIGLLAEKDYRVRLAAVHTLGEIGRNATEAVPALLASIRQKDAAFFKDDVPQGAWTGYRFAVVRTLSKIDDPATPALLRALLGEDDEEVHQYLVAALLSIEPEDEDFAAVGQQELPELLRLLKSDDIRVRSLAIDAIGAFGPDAADLTGDLLQAAALLSDEERADRNLRDYVTEYPRRLVEAINKLGEGAVPTIAAAWEHEDARIRDVARAAMRRIAPEPEVLLRLTDYREAILKDAMLQPGLSIGKHAAEALVLQGTASVPLLTELAQHENFAVSQEAHAALAKLYEEAALPLTKMLSSDDRALRIIAARALGGRGPSRRGYIPVSVVLPALEEALGDEERMVRRYAARSMLWLDPQQAKRLGAEDVIRKLEAKKDPLERAKQRLREERQEKSARAAGEEGSRR